MLPVAISSCNLEWFQKNPNNRCRKQNLALLCAIVASQKSCETNGNGACYTLHPCTCVLSRNAIATHAAKKIAPCNTSCRDRFYLLQRLQGFLETIVSYNPRLQRVIICLLQVAMDFYFHRCERSCNEDCIT